MVAASHFAEARDKVEDVHLNLDLDRIVGYMKARHAGLLQSDLLLADLRD